MVNQVINGLIAGVIGAVAFIAVRALVGGSIYGPNSNCPYNTSYCLDPLGETNFSNCTGGNFTPTAGELMIHDILPLAIAIIVVAGLFMGLTRVRGV